MMGILLYGIVIGIFWYLRIPINTPHVLDNWFKLPTPNRSTNQAVSLPEWRNGNASRLEIEWRNPCGFESLLRHICFAVVE